MNSDLAMIIVMLSIQFDAAYNTLFPQMSQTLTSSNAADNGLSASKTQECDEIKRSETMDESVELPPDRMEQGPNNVSNMKQEEDERQQNKTMDEAMELELDGVEQGPNYVSSKEQDPPSTSLVIANGNQN